MSVNSSFVPNSMFFQGIYDIHNNLSGMPLLAWEPPPLSFNMVATLFMNHPVVTLQPVESVRRIVRVLRAKSYNGFPIVMTKGVSTTSIFQFQLYLIVCFTKSWPHQVMQNLLGSGTTK